MVNVPVGEMQAVFQSVLLKKGLAKERAAICAETFALNSFDGILSHGIYRFPRFVDFIDKGIVRTDVSPSLISRFNGIEQWEGNLGIGILNAFFATDQCMKLASEYGIGCVTLANTNHWMRAGTYGRKAAGKGFVFVGWTNTIANMPAWGALDAKLGNNPLVMALPYKENAIVLDMAVSQFSFGKMEMMTLKNEKLPVTGGFDKFGKMTNDPAEIIESGRPMPVGYWKGAGLSLLLDLLATVLSGGQSTRDISRNKPEHGVSQVFIAIDIGKLPHHSSVPQIIDNIISDYKESTPENEQTAITYPGENVLKTRERNLKSGIPVLKTVWDQISLL